MYMICTYIYYIIAAIGYTCANSMINYYNNSDMSQRPLQTISTNATMSVSMTTVSPSTVSPPRYINPKPDDVKVGCLQLLSKRYISDGFCTSIKPIKDVVCAGTCLPIKQLPWYAEIIKVLSRSQMLEYRCVDDVVRTKTVTFECQNGETRTYRIRVVKSCKCKRYGHRQNNSKHSKKHKNRNHRRKKKSRRRERNSRDL